MEYLSAHMTCLCQVKNGIDNIQEQKLGKEQLDDSIVDTLVSALLPMSAFHIFSC
jgi:hypothetical protein